LAVAEALAAEECDLIITSRNQAHLTKAEKKLATYNRRVLARECDVRNLTAIVEMVGAVKGEFSRIDVLINNAGISHPNLSVDKLPIETWHEVIETNLTGMFVVTRAVLPLLNRGGTIVNNLSVAAKRIFPGSSAYGASKHGGLAFTNSLREELRERGIRVMALLAGATDTAIWDTLWPEAPREKMMSPASVAQALVDALIVPAQSVVEELVIRPMAGTL
jgi:short-subunit dehydrogenase